MFSGSSLIGRSQSRLAELSAATHAVLPAGTGYHGRIMLDRN